MSATTSRPSAATRRTAGRRAAAACALVAAAGLVTAGAASASTTTGSATATSAGSSSSGTYQFRTLDNHRDLTFNQLLGINDNGVIAGYFGSGTPARVHPNKGYTLMPPYNQGDYTNENFPGSQQTQVVGINNAGTTVGFWVRGSDGANFGFVDWHGHFTSVTDPHTSSSPTFNQLLGVNNNGVAVGFYNDSAGNAHGYTYDIRTQQFTAVRVSGATSVTAAGINDDGDITGFATFHGGTTEAFLIRGNSTTLTKVRGSANTMALGINNDDDVVGSFVDAAGNTHGFVAHDLMNATKVDDPHGIGTTVVNGLNNLGQLVGFYVDSAGNTDGFLATPW